MKQEDKMSKTKLVPFDIEKAKNGAKVVTRNGLPVRIGFYDVIDPYYPILGVIKLDDDKEAPYSFTEKGKYHKDDDVVSFFDLFIEEEIKFRKMTNRELWWWLREHPEEHREYCYDSRNGVPRFYYEYSYIEEDADKEAEDVLIRRNGGEWEEPLIEE